MNDELLARGEVTFEASANFRDIDTDSSGIHAVLRDLHNAAVHRRFYTAFDNQRVAVGNFNALQFDVWSHREFAAGLRGRGRVG